MNIINDNLYNMHQSYSHYAHNPEHLHQDFCSINPNVCGDRLWIPYEAPPFQQFPTGDPFGGHGGDEGVMEEDEEDEQEEE